MDEHFPQIIRQWLGKQRGADNESIDTPTKEAANICGRSQETSRAAKGTEPVNRKERARYNAAVKPLEESALQVWAPLLAQASRLCLSSSSIHSILKPTPHSESKCNLSQWL